MNQKQPAARLIEPRLMGQPAHSLYLCLMAGPVLLFPYLCELHVLLRQDLAVGVRPDFLQLRLLLPCNRPKNLWNYRVTHLDGYNLLLT